MPVLDLTPSMIGAMTNILKVQAYPMRAGPHVEPRTRTALIKRGLVQEVSRGVGSVIELTAEGIEALRAVGAQGADLVLQDALRAFDAEVSAKALLAALQQAAPKSISQLDGTAYWPSWLKLTTSTSGVWHTSRSASDKVRKIRAELHLAAAALPIAIKQREEELEQAKVFAAELEAVRALLEAPQA